MTSVCTKKSRRLYEDVRQAEAKLRDAVAAARAKGATEQDLKDLNSIDEDRFPEVEAAREAVTMANFAVLNLRTSTETLPAYTASAASVVGRAEPAAQDPFAHRLGLDLRVVRGEE